MKKYIESNIEIILLEDINVITGSNEAEWDFPDDEEPEAE